MANQKSSLASLPPPDDPPTDSASENSDSDDDARSSKKSRDASKHLSKSEKLDARSQQMLAHQVNILAFPVPPPLHNVPAPPALPSQGDPTLPHNRAPLKSTLGLRKSYLDRFLNSTLGRFSQMFSVMLMSNAAILGFANWNAPEHRLEGMSFIYFFLTMILTFCMYTLPLLADRSGMSARETGWKPYLVLYRLAYILLIPAVIFQSLGNGAELSFGTAAGGAGDIALEFLPNKYWSYFELIDGFVGLNLTKGIAETMMTGEHGQEGSRRNSRFRDAELRVNYEPFTDEVEPTETPGKINMYRIAPVFSQWDICSTNYKVSAACLRRNKIRAWAISRTTSICSSLRMAACSPPKPVLDPIYKCGDPATRVRGMDDFDSEVPAVGLCGRVTSPPPDGAIDEFRALLTYDSFPKRDLPTKDSLWLDVAPDDCLDDLASCKSQWSNFATIGLLFQVLANVFLLIAIIQDCRTDLKVREAQAFIEVQEKMMVARKLASIGPGPPGR